MPGDAHEFDPDPHIPESDGFYEELVNAQRDMDNAQAERMMAKLVLILSNHVGDRSILSEAIALARNNTLKSANPKA
ncbi:MAG: DUF2783 domain-containing protein [Betaproteobacteria bacterium]|nr:DUF2783 domain-containing protein [Betaproteobacteria bacterium]